MRGTVATCVVILTWIIGSHAQLVPEFDQNLYNLTFNQNALQGSTVLTLGCTYSGTVLFQIEQFSDNTEFLDVDGSTGVLSFSMDALDVQVRVYTVSIRCSDALDSTKSDLAIVTASRVDENEHVPVFSTNDPLRINVFEDRVFSQAIATVHATDEDRGSLGAITYEIQSGLPIPFEIGPESGELNILSSLDYEDASAYQFLVAAVNPPVLGSGFVLSSQILVSVDVANINDRSPEFTSGVYQVMVHETAPDHGYPRPSPGFFSVECTDLDNPPSDITYAISSEGDPGPFTLDTQTGALTITQDLDYENRTSYSFEVNCSDVGTPRFTATSLVEVTVLPVNEVRPTLTAIGSDLLLVTEDLPVGTVLLATDPDVVSFRMYSVTDSDSGADGVITFTLSSDESGNLGINATTGTVYLVDELDIDSGLASFFRFTVVACDVDPPDDECPSESYRIFVFASADELPQFSQSAYTAAPSELVLPMTVILQATCEDQDVGDGAFEGIFLANATSEIVSTFSVNTATGAISTLGPLDYEATQNYTFALECLDTVGERALTTVFIEVQPENDNAPQFTSSLYVFELSQTTPPYNYPVGTVRATDTDVGRGGDLEYMIDTNEYFVLTSDGTLELVASVAEYAFANISVSVHALDGNFSDSALVQVVLTEGNFNPPRFVGSAQTVQVSELTVIGTVVADVLCTDEDSGSNANITYSITDGNTDSSFTIDPITGVISSAGALVLADGLTEERYLLQIDCFDNGLPLLSDVTVVHVRVFQDTSTPLMIANETIFAFVSESASINEQVVTIEPVDFNSGNLRFALVNESTPGAFIIDPSTGVVLVAAALDRESVAVYQMTVVVMEVLTSVGPERSDSAMLIVYVRDVNDNSPSCDTSRHTATLPENSSPGSAVLQLVCSDLDIQENGELDYYFLDSGVLGETSGVFAINNSGVVVLESSLNATDSQIIVATVVVSDRGQLALTSTYQITVFVSLANRFAPVFNNLPTAIQVGEATGLYEVVFTVQASDSDRGTFGQVVYSIADSQATFGVFSSSGGIFLTESLDFYQQSQYVLNISASDIDFTVTETLTISVVDENEFSPECESTFLVATIYEGLPANTTLPVRFSCSDEDKGPNGELSFRILSGDTSNSFEVLPSGEVVAVKTLDFEAVQSYTLEVEIADQGQPQLNVTSVLLVTVLPVNEFAPAFEYSVYNTSVVENLAVGQSVLRVSAMDADGSDHPDGQVVYSVCDAGGLSVFTVSVTGDILVAGAVDREERSVYFLTLCARDLGQPTKTGTTLLQIDVTDVDDNPPHFSESVYISALNHTPGDSSDLSLSVACFDPDTGGNVDISYSLDPLTSDSQFFQINSTTGRIRAKGVVTLSRTYTFTVVCTGPPPLELFDTAIVGVQVVIASNITFYPSSVYNITIPEDTALFSSILNLNATSSHDVTLTYTLQGHNSLFSIDLNTGIVLLTSELDYESATSYVFTAQAFDGVNTGEALIEVLVGNVNDVVPVISTMPMEIALNESSLVGTVAVYECFDPEEGPLGQVSFLLKSGDPESTFSLSVAGLLELSTELDYEQTQQYSLEIVCVDGGIPPLSTSMMVPITVLPINDNHPTFTDGFIQFVVSEDLQVGSELGTIVATDTDLPPHGNLHYIILLGDENENFEISSTTGVLTLVDSLDYEDTTQIFLVVQVDDSGGETMLDYPVLSSMTTVVINVLDYNDNTPEFSQPAYVGEVNENAFLGMAVTFEDPILCTDADSGTNAEVLLFIPDDVPFSIHPSTGAVTVQGELLQRVYYLTAQCQDSGFPRLTSQASVIVSVTEINEFGPQFNLSLYRFQINESSPIGTQVGQLSAVDLDFGEHGVITYELVNATESQFSVDSGTGLIHLLFQIDYETEPHLHILQAVATDTAGLQDSSTVVIEVLNTDDNVPVFTQSTYFASVPENSPLGSVVGQVSCTDADDQADSVPVTYALVTSGVPFEIDSGSVIVAGGIDTEAVPRYSLDIACNDSAGNSAIAVMVIEVAPVNEFPPSFTETEYTIEITENLPIGQSILKVNATDGDALKYNDITFSFVAGNEESRFGIDPSSGVVTVTNSIDREEEDSYELVVQAQNVIPSSDTSGSQPLSAMSTVNITVVDVNDNSPSILPSDVTAFIPENTNGTIAEFICTDADLGTNGTVNFSIMSGSEDERFNISSSGVLTVTQFSGRDTVVQVTCSDLGNPPLSTTTFAIVHGTSMNDHVPTFSQASYATQVLENMIVGENIDCFLATDSDDPDTPDGIIRYSLQPVFLGGDSSGRFSIQEDTGCVFVSIALDVAVSTTYTYYIVAMDSGQPPFSSNATLVITVLDIVQAPPTFVGGPYTRIVSEGVEGGTFIFGASCMDSDDSNEISYAIINDDYSGLFSIENTTGIVSLTTDSVLDYETNTAHTLQVTCSDTFGLSDTASVFITVTPVNEFTPSFQSVVTAIPEHSVIGTPVTQLEWTDADTGPDGQSSFSITTGDADNVFFVSSDGQLVVVGNLDREYQDTYSLEIEITDLSDIVDDRRMSRNLVNITITDINDNRPVFAVDSPYAPDPLQGNEPVGHIVGAVQCFDADIGSNALVTYQVSASNPEHDLFDVDPDTGEIRTTGSLETRETDSFSFLVECHDLGVVQLTSTSLVTVSVVEININAPVFENMPYYTAILENTEPPVSLLTVHANDSDAGASGRSEYFIEDGYDSLFSVDAVTGEISLLGPLDFEESSSYLLTVGAVDGTGDSQIRFTTTTNVTIDVLPVNEHVPVCIELQYEAIINESTVGTVLYLECTDDDGGADGELVYSFLSGNETGYFQISSDGGISIPNPVTADQAMEQFYLTVVVRDRGSPPLQTQVNVVVVYSFADLGTPSFSESVYHFNVSELTDVGRVIAAVQAFDPDPGLQGQLTYSINTSENFAVNPSSGQIYVSSLLDYEVKPQEQFTLLAQDGDPESPLTGSTTVVVSITNEDDTTPQCPLQIYTATLQSSARFNDTVFDLGCADGDGGRLSFQLVSSSGKRQTNTLAVDNTTGRVYVAAPPTPSTTTVDGILITDSSGETTEISFAVEVAFANTEAPVFTEDEYMIDVGENTTLLTRIGSVVANDPDSAYVTYNLVHPDLFSQFYLNQYTGELILIEPLDYELQTLYSFVIQVTDEGSYDGSNQLSDTAVVTVNVLNANDNAPRFSSEGTFSTTVNQSTPEGTPVFSFTCTDEDDSITAPTVSEENFAISPFSLQSAGVEHTVLVSKELNISSRYNINVTCTDTGGLSTEEQIVIVVPEVNAPIFSMPVYQWEISENAEFGSTFSSVKASTGTSEDAITYSIAEGHDRNLFYIHSTTGVVTLVGALDYETQQTHMLVITATDSRNSQSNVLLIVQVEDENDQVPLTDPTTVLQVEQNAPVGYPLGVLQCSDSDTNPNATMYEIALTQSGSPFSITEYGVVRVRSSLDDTPVYVLTVRCRDITDTSMFSTGVLTIEVQSNNQHTPQFELDSYAYIVSESVSFPLEVGRVEATDRDQGSYGELRYSFTGGNSELFYIEAETGMLALLSSLDYEEASSYAFTVEAIDGGLTNFDDSLRKTGTAVVTILVEDTNDNFPVPNQSSYAQTIDNSHVLFTPVLDTGCTDSDSSNNGIIRYSLSPPQLDFVVDRNGTVVLTREQRDSSLFRFNVVCSDGGNPTLSSSSLVTITVNDIDLPVPSFNSTRYRTVVLETHAVFTAVTTVSASAPNGSYDITYDLEDGNGTVYFYIDSNSGVVFLFNSLGANQQSEHTLVVRASDSRRPSLFSLATIQVEVLRVNVNAPSFSSPLYLAQVPEGMEVGAPITQVQCTDSDTDADITYKLTNTPLEPYLTIVENSGIILVAGELDYESTTLYTMEVTCSDGGDSPLTAKTTVRIEVLPVNEFVPEFLEPVYQFTATENSFGTLLGRVEAVDPDAGSQGDISYQLLLASSSPVIIEPSTGDVLASNLDYEAQSQWNLTVVARDGGGMEAFVPLVVFVLNVNDALPILSPIVSTFSIPLDTPTVLPIEQYTCTDEDTDNVTISISSGSNLEFFSLSPFNQLLWVGNTMELSSDAVFSVTIECIAVQAGPNNATIIQTAEAHIIVTVQGVVVASPQFSEDVYNTTIPESTAVGSPILTVYASGSGTDVVYDLSGASLQLPFVINGTTGVVYVASELNHELTPQYVFTVRTVDEVSGLADLALVSVTVEDDNDNRPFILPSLHTVVLPEDYPMTSIASFACTDNDLGSFGETEFVIVGGSEEQTFNITPSGSVELVGTLDLETVGSYNVTIACVDTGEPPLSGLASLVVTVTGVNEFAPRFQNSSYEFAPLETLGAGEVVGMVTATDEDGGADGHVSYAITSTSDAGFFSVDLDGQIHTTTQTLNATDQMLHQLTIEASDPGSMTDRVQVNISVVDVNEPPKFAEGTSFLATTTSNETAGATILTILCFDTDTGDNSVLSVELSSNPSNLDVYLQTPGNTTAEGSFRSSITTNSSLAPGAYEVAIRCSDHGDPPLSTEATATIRVQGVNAPPSFVNNTPLAISVAEDSEVGTLLQTIEATDDETEVVYATTGGTGLGTFAIDPTTGELSLVLPLDYEITPAYTLTITAHDQAVANSLSVSTEINILVQNVNDLHPALTPLGFQIRTLSENADPVFDITSYSCIDADGGDVTMTLSPPYDGSINSPFDIASDGTIQLLQAVDYEQKSLYVIVVTCTDVPIAIDGGNSLATSTDLTIYITPENNFAPKFVSPSVFEVSEATQAGAVIATVQATDRDNRGQITYSTSSHTDLFHIDPSSGNITLIQQLDYEATQQYNLTIEASDNDNTLGRVQPKTNSQVFTIQVVDVDDNRNDNIPRFNQSLYHGSILENQPNGSFILQVSATDVDLGTNAQFVFLLDAVTEFSVDPQSGEIVTTEPLDFESATSYNFLVYASDFGSPQRTGSAAVTVRVLDENDVPPSFSQPVYTAAISDISQRGHEALRFNVTDPDTVGSLLFQLNTTDPRITGLFGVEQDTGTLVQLAPVSRDSLTQRYEFTVEVSDGVSSDFTAVIINVEFVNDNTPRFNQSLYQGSILENQPNGSSILRVSASDMDLGTNAQFVFSLDAVTGLSIVPQSGEIVTTEPLDFESTTSHNFFVYASDFGTPQRTGSAAVTVRVLDENDVPPSFSQPVYTATISDLSQRGHEVLRFNVTDPDTVGSLLFQLNTTDPRITGLFGVEQDTGTLIQLAPVSRDSLTQRYEFTVEVSDGVSSDFTAVIIYVDFVSSTMIVVEENSIDFSFDVQNFLMERNFDISSISNYFIIEGNEGGEFTISSNGLLSLQRPLNRELVSQYVLTIQVSDVHTSETVNLTLITSVSDQNDNEPVFNISPYVFNLTEATYTTATSIGRVLATDADEVGTTNSQIEYSLIGTTPAFLSIDHQTGELFVQGTVDREAQASYDITVRANDLGGPSPLASTAEVQLVIADVNDNHPRFVLVGVLEFVVSIMEGAPIGTEVHTITAVLDGGIEVALSAFEFYDPDTTGEVSSELSTASEASLTFRLKDVDGNGLKQVLETTSVVGREVNGTILLITLRDEPADVETNPIKFTILVLVADTPTPSPMETPPPVTDQPDSSEDIFTTTTIASVSVVVVLIIVVLSCSACNALLWHHNRSKKESYEVQTYNGRNPIHSELVHRSRSARPYGMSGGEDTDSGSSSGSELPEKLSLSDTGGPPPFDSARPGRHGSIALVPTSLGGATPHYSHYPIPPGASLSQGVGLSQGFALQGYGLSQEFSQGLSQPMNLSLYQGYSLSQAHDFPHPLPRAHNVVEGSQSESIQEASTQF